MFLFSNFLKFILNLFQFSFLFYSVITIKEENENLINKGDLSQFDSSGCGLTKGCLFKPPNCNPYNDCSYVLSYISDDERVYFELLAQVAGESNVWAAVGFSVDGLMVKIICKSNRKAPLAYGLESKILHTHHAKVADGIIYCRFSQLIQPPESVQPQFVRPLNAPIFILLASGVTRGKDLTIHSLNSDSSLFPFSSPHPIQLTKFNLSPEELANGDWEINNNNNNFINSSLNLSKELSIPFNENNSSSPVIEQTTINNCIYS
ncbi:unnamed protein product [Meloidogyne enterolobii]|uniref:Uncharacterized protein n=1 Tax=Meloidogyne enterolobii TaxID=390850 RepID=A0ACB0Y2X6_MELEN